MRMKSIQKKLTDGGIKKIITLKVILNYKKIAIRNDNKIYQSKKLNEVEIE